MEDYVYQLAAPSGFGRGGKTCFAARASGLFRSDDGGLSWKAAYESLGLQEPLPTLAVAVEPNVERHPRLFTGISGGILHTRDDGKTWQTAQVPTPPPAVAALALSPRYDEDGMIFAATLEDGVIFSADRGDKWVAWNFGLLDLNTLCLCISPQFAQDETVFIGTQTGIFRSTNGGRAWREVELPVGFEAVLSLAISPRFADDGVIYAGTESQGLLRTQNGSETWQRLAEGAFDEHLNAVILAPDFPQKPEILALHGGEVLHSRDSGSSWAKWRAADLAEGEVTAIHAPLGFGPDAPALAGLSDGRILRL